MDKHCNENKQRTWAGISKEKRNSYSFSLCLSVSVSMSLCFSSYMCVCVYIYICVCVCVCAYIYLNIISMCIYIHIISVYVYNIHNKYIQRGRERERDNLPHYWSGKCKSREAGAILKCHLLHEAFPDHPIYNSSPIYSPIHTALITV